MNNPVAIAHGSIHLHKGQQNAHKCTNFQLCVIHWHTSIHNRMTDQQIQEHEMKESMQTTFLHWHLWLDARLLYESYVVSPNAMEGVLPQFPQVIPFALNKPPKFYVLFETCIDPRPWFRWEACSCIVCSVITSILATGAFLSLMYALFTLESQCRRCTAAPTSPKWSLPYMYGAVCAWKTCHFNITFAKQVLSTYGEAGFFFLSQCLPFVSTPRSS